MGKSSGNSRMPHQMGMCRMPISGRFWCEIKLATGRPVLPTNQGDHVRDLKMVKEHQKNPH